jgi:glutaminyl-peptide cyclotransferase
MPTASAALLALLLIADAALAPRPLVSAAAPGNPAATATALPGAPAATTALPGAPAATPAATPVALSFEVVTRRAHDPDAFTQGLVLDGDGRLYESTGLLGRSSLREVDRWSGETLRAVNLPDDHFGEGLALVGDRLVQLTWRNGVAHVWDADTFAPAGSFAYGGEGWGLCYDGRRLVMSDGSARLTFRDPDTFDVLGDIVVHEAGRPLPDLNELECADGAVWANVFGSDRIARIDPASGRVSGSLDLSGILEPHPRDARAGAVLNGIAHDGARDTFLVTGKLWPELIEIRVHEPRTARAGAGQATQARPQPYHPRCLMSAPHALRATAGPTR